MRIHLKTLLPIVTVIALAVGGCAGVVVKEVDYTQARLVPEDAHPRPIMFSKLRFLLPPGTEIGLESGTGIGLGSLCSWENYPVSRRVFNRSMERQYVQDTFATALESNGYDVVENIDIDYRPEDELQRAEYSVSARVKDIDVDMCHRTPDALGLIPTLGGRPGTKGKLYARFEWTVYDMLRRTVVYQTSTEGYTRRDYPNAEGMELMFYDAFDMATHNLAADENFYGLIVEGKKPPEGWRGKDRGFEDAPKKFDSRETVDIPRMTLSNTALPEGVEKVRAANVLVQKAGHGSGFFITKQGHILTNQHVVGDATRMRIVTRGKEHKLVAEVLRVDKVRDVALLKLEEIPDGLEIEPLPVRLEKLSIAEDVYALGNPLLYGSLQDSVTKGIVSAHRLRKDEGVRLPFIQADVEIHSGNSGGALLDAHGNIVGLAVSGMKAQAEVDSGIGLNFFIPIAEALRALDITVGGHKVPAYAATESEKDEESASEAADIPAPEEE